WNPTAQASTPAAIDAAAPTLAIFDVSRKRAVGAPAGHEAARRGAAGRNDGAAQAADAGVLHDSAVGFGAAPAAPSARAAAVDDDRSRPRRHSRLVLCVE